MKIFIKYIPLLLIVLLPSFAAAQSQYLVGIPGITDGEDLDFNAYINALYAMFISLAALLAVVKIIVAGLKYMFSDIVTQKSEAKKDIRGALLGLVIVLAAVLILTVINRDLTNFELDIERTTYVPRQEPNAFETFEKKVQSERRYTSLLGGTLAEQVAYGSDCAQKGNRFQLSATGGPQCFERDQEDLNVLEDTLSNGSVDDSLVDNAVTQYDRNVTPNIISDEIELDQISAELGVNRDKLLFSTYIPARLEEFPGFESGLNLVCKTYSQAQNNDAIELVYEPGNGFATCVDGS